MIQPGARSARTATLRLALCMLAVLLALLLVLQPVGAREIIVEDVSNPAGDHEVIPSIGRGGDDENRHDEQGEEQGAQEERRRQMREIIVEDVSNPGRDNEVIPSVGREGNDDREEGEDGEQDEERRRRQMREIIVEDVSNPGRDNEVVPSVGREGDNEREDDEQGEDEMKEETDWNPFGYRRLQDLPGEVLPAEVIAKWTNPPNADDPDAWKKDMDEMMALLESAVQSEMNSTIEARVGPDGQVVEEASNFANLLNTISQSPDKLFPMCSPVGFVTRIPHLLCAITVISARIVIRGPPDFSNLADEHHFPNPGYHLPLPLEDLSEKPDGTPVPFIIDKELVKREHATIAWYCRHVYNMYAYVFKFADDVLTDHSLDHKSLRPLIPVGWGNQELFFVRTPTGWVWPMGQCLTKGDLMTCFFRGTMGPGGWMADYSFPWADLDQTKKMGLPGRVHRGFFNFASQFFKAFERQADLNGIKSITFTGHSLGGAIAQISSVFMHINHPYLKINCVTFGSPQVGDREFTDYMNHKINLRRVAYLGSGQLDIPQEKHLTYGFGDIVTQMPVACEGLKMPACKALDFAPDTEGLGSFQYAMGAGNIPIYAHDLKNTEGWLKKENYVFGARQYKDIPEGIMASHICSYQCWASLATGDPDDRCFFPGDPGADPRYVCAVDFSESLLNKYPNVKTPPADLGNVIAEISGADPTQVLQRKLRSSPAAPKKK